MSEFDSMIAGSSPGAPALDDLSTARSWAGFDDRICRLVGVFRARGLEPGMNIAVMMHNSTEMLEVVVACLVGGYWCTPVNWHLVEAEVDYILTDCQASLVVSDEEFDEVHGCGGHNSLGSAELEVALADIAAPALDMSCPVGSIMFYTGGTTGKPKGVRPAVSGSVGEYMELLRSAAERVGLDALGPHLVTGPLYHGAPLISALQAIAVGAEVIILKSFDAGQVLDIITERRVRDTHLVPIMFVRMLKLPDEQRASFDPSSLRTVHHGAAPVAVGIKAQMIEWWGPVFREYFASTEGGLYTEIGSLEWLEHPGSVGKPVAAYEIYAATENGTRLAPGEIGTLFIRDLSGRRPFEYYKDATKTAATFVDESTFSIGDIGYVDNSGYVYLTDRTSEIIISGGVNVYPAEIEAGLVTHPDVLDAAIYSLPNEEWGETVHAAVAVRPDRGAMSNLTTELYEHLASRVASYKVPKTIRIVAELPRSDTGKLYRRQLRKLHMAVEAEMSPTQRSWEATNDN